MGLFALQGLFGENVSGHELSGAPAGKPLLRRLRACVVITHLQPAGDNRARARERSTPREDAHTHKQLLQARHLRVLARLHMDVFG